MRRCYDDELAALPDAYAAVRRMHDGAIATLRTRLIGAPAVFVGAGGAFAVARLAADLHERYCGKPARAATPLEIIGQPPPSEVTVVLISARARHPDTQDAAKAAIAAGSRRLLLVTQRAPAYLTGVLTHPLVSHHQIPSSEPGDGFLATGSVIAASALFVRAYASSASLPEHLPGFDKQPLQEIRERILVLPGPGTYPIAYDIEARFNETGLADVELADYRNFAHGRHVGLMRRINSTTIIAIYTSETSRLADRTLRELPDEAQTIRLASPMAWPTAAIDLLARAAPLITAPARRSNLNPSKPNVPEFGRRLYHLPTRSLHREIVHDPVRCKLAEAVKDGPFDVTYEKLRKNFEVWLKCMRSAKFLGLVLDYDGTVCATSERFDLPRVPIRKEIERLLSAGTAIGFASGRGASLHRDLRKWIPTERQKQIHLGLYNGALRLNLAQDLPETMGPALKPVADAYQRLLDDGVADLFSLSLRKYQLTVEQHANPNMSMDALVNLIGSILYRPPHLPIKLVTSGHSLDITSAWTTKTSVVDDIYEAIEGNDILAIGDQGHLTGNDFELLAHGRFSLSVDRCSGDPSRCWNLSTEASRGPDALLQYLYAIRLHPDGTLRFHWPDS